MEHLIHSTMYPDIKSLASIITFSSRPGSSPRIHPSLLFDIEIAYVSLAEDVVLRRHLLTLDQLKARCSTLAFVFISCI